jgi:large subunit ribosomal protein L23
VKFYSIFLNRKIEIFIDKKQFKNLFMNLNKTNNENSICLWNSQYATPEKLMIHFIKQPVNTQKSFYSMSKNKQYTFDVDPRLTKSQIKKLFEKLFGVNIIEIQTHIPPRRKIRVGNVLGSSQKTKRVIFTLKQGETLNF